MLIKCDFIRKTWTIYIRFSIALYIKTKLYQYYLWHTFWDACCNIQLVVVLNINNLSFSWAVSIDSIGWGYTSTTINRAFRKAWLVRILMSMNTFGLVGFDETTFGKTNPVLVRLIRFYVIPHENPLTSICLATPPPPVFVNYIGDSKWKIWCIEPLCVKIDANFTTFDKSLRIQFIFERWRKSFRQNRLEVIDTM